MNITLSAISIPFNVLLPDNEYLALSYMQGVNTIYVTRIILSFPPGRRWLRTKFRLLTASTPSSPRRRRSLVLNQRHRVDVSLNNYIPLLVDSANREINIRISLVEISSISTIIWLIYDNVEIILKSLALQN